MRAAVEQMGWDELGRALEAASPAKYQEALGYLRLIVAAELRLADIDAHLHAINGSAPPGGTAGGGSGD